MLEIPQDILDIVNFYKGKYKNAKWAEAGHNGPYGIKENVYRNTSHWIMSFGTMYRITKEKVYLQIVDKFADTLHQAVKNTKRGAIETMEGQLNLVAVAWIVEGLLEAAELLDRNEYLMDAEYIWKAQEYDTKLHIWNMVNDEGIVLGKDVAFNHNLWFAMAGIKIYEASGKFEYREIVEDFLKHCGSHFLVYKDGRISHFIVNSGNWKFDLINRIRKICIEISKVGTPWNKSNQAEYERAYHLFSIYAFAQIYELMPELKIFSSPKFTKAKEYALDVTNFTEFDEKSNYAYGYNSPYYEFPLIEYIFTNNEKKVKKHMDELGMKQNAYRKTLLGKKEKLDDPITLDARIYELLQLFYVRCKENEKDE